MSNKKSEVLMENMENKVQPGSFDDVNQIATEHLRNQKNVQIHNQHILREQLAELFITRKRVQQNINSCEQKLQEVNKNIADIKLQEKTLSELQAIRDKRKQVEQKFDIKAVPAQVQQQVQKRRG